MKTPPAFPSLSPLRRRTAALCLAGSMAGEALALAPVNPHLTAAGREILDYLESQNGIGHVSGCNIYDRAPNSYMSVGRRGVIWMDNMEWMSAAKADTMIADYRKYRPIFCFGWHWQLGDKWDTYGNPINRTSPDPYPQELEVARVLDPSTPEYGLMLQDLDAVAAIFKRFQDAGVPILWRGMHENGGGWFWYDDNETPENTAALWRFTYDYFTTTKAIDNLVWYYNAGQGLRDDWDYRQRFYPGNAYADFVDVNMYDSDHTIDTDGQAWYFDMMRHITGDAKMIGGGDQPLPQTADYMAEGRFPKWLIGTPWEGAPFTPRGYTARWARYHYNHPFVVSLDEAPAFGAALNNPTLYPNICPEVGIVGPEIQTWTYGATPVIEAFAKDRDGNVSKVELYAQNIVTGSSQKIATLTSGTAGLYRFHWSGMPDGFYKVTAVATDNSANVSDSTNMGACWQWKNWAWITKGYHNIAKKRPATASSFYLDRVPARATDGDYESEWESDFKNSPDPNDAWLAVDLGASYSISQVNLRWGWKAYADTFEISVSTDGSTWTQVYSKSGFVGDTTWAAVSACTFPATTARHVRFHGTKQKTGNSAYFGYKLAEIEVPIPLAAIPAGTPEYLDLHNRVPFSPRAFDRTVYGTPASVVAGGTFTSYARDYFDAVGEQLCGAVKCGTGYSQFYLQPYDSTARNLSAFSSGNIHFAARASIPMTWQLLVRGTSGTTVIEPVALTDRWQAFDVPVSEVAAKGVNLAAVKQPFILQKSGSAGTLYLRDVYWSTTPPGATAGNLIADGSFDANNAEFSTARSVSKADAGAGWKAGSFNTLLPLWDKDTANDRATLAAGGRCPGLAQVIGDRRSTVGTQSFSFKATNTGTWGSPNYLAGMVWGINEDGWSMDLAFEDAETGIGPVDRAGYPAGVLLGAIEIDGTSFTDQTLILDNLDFGPGYDEVAVLFWTKDADASKGEVQRIDEVTLGAGDGASGGNPVVNPEFDSALVGQTSWADSTRDKGTGWVIQSGTAGSRWNRVAAADSYAAADNAGANAMVQIIQGTGLAGTKTFSFDVANSGANTLKVYVWGVNAECKVNLYDAAVPKSTSYGNLVPAPVELFKDESLGGTTYGWKTVSGTLNLGASGYQYIVIKAYTNGVNSPKYQWIDSVKIE